MTHVSEERLLLHYYGEESDGGEVERHLEACGVCRQQYQALQRTLNVVEATPVPARGPEYGAQVWSRVAPQLGIRVRRERGWLSWKWTKAAAVAVLVVCAFLAGRYAPRPSGPAAPQTAGNTTRERVLLVAVGDHLERMQMVLVELQNAEPLKKGGVVDIADEQRQAEDLVESNRLFRTAATVSGDDDMASLLEELERVLLDVKNRDPRVPADELAELHKRIEAQGLLFKMRVIGSKVRDEAADEAARKPAGERL